MPEAVVGPEGIRLAFTLDRVMGFPVLQRAFLTLRGGLNSAACHYIMSRGIFRSQVRANTSLSPSITLILPTS